MQQLTVQNEDVSVKWCESLHCVDSFVCFSETKKIFFVCLWTVSQSKSLQINVRP